MRLPWSGSPEEREQRLLRLREILDVPLALLALAWVVVIVIDLTGVAPPEVLPYIQTADSAVWLLFLAEFLLEFVIAPNKISYLADNWIIAISVILPFFGILRVLRAVYAFRTLSLARIVLGANRATRGASEILGRGGFQYVAAIILLAVVLGAAAVSFFERAAPTSELASFSQALWWAVALITTINTDTDPVTAEGRVVAVLLRVVGLSVFGYLTASIASYLVGASAGPAAGAASEREEEQRQALAEIRDELAAIRARLDRSGE